jgi:hypothetical protein
VVAAASNAKPKPSLPTTTPGWITQRDPITHSSRTTTFAYRNVSSPIAASGPT